MQNQRGMSTIVTILLTILIAAGLGAGAYFGYNWWQKQAEKDTGSSDTTPTTPTAPADPTAGWQSYTDSENGFSLKYPPGWTTKVGNFSSTHGIVVKDYGFLGTGESVFVTVRTNPETTLRAFVDADSVTGVTAATVGDLSGFAAVTTDSYRVYLENSSKIYMFTFPSAQTNTDLSTEQVNLLTSISFTTSSTTPSTTPTTP